MLHSTRIATEKQTARRMLRTLFLIALGIGAVAAAITTLPDSDTSTTVALTPDALPEENVRVGIATEHMHVYWKGAANENSEYKATPDHSNVRRSDYVGPDACRKCHRKQHDDWSTHSHRWMNALATDRTVKGDFSGTKSIVFHGATGEFYRENDRFLMRISRKDSTQVHEIHQTLGSRFFQYYIGAATQGAPPDGSDTDDVLPFGYWLDRKMWVPIVHITPELPDEDGRFNVFDPAPPHAGQPGELNYAARCSHCHVTLPLSDVMFRYPELIGNHAPSAMYMSVSDYMSSQYPEFLTNVSSDGANDLLRQMDALRWDLAETPASQRAVTLGISCEACHLGCRAHTEGERKKPSFVASGPELYLAEFTKPVDTGRTVANINWVCSRCHWGDRPQFAAGMATWNSTEFADASRGACYSQLTCVECHDPHRPIGPKWTRSLEQDDAVCLKCHQTFSDPVQRSSHTHHQAGSEGDSCINCHMPKINEGMQDVVRTHTIYSPTEPEMIERAHPNACNLCHLDKAVDWTLQHLTEWYNSEFLENRIAKNYPEREEPLARVWLTHENESVRLVAVDAASRREAQWALPEIIDQLDDPYLLNRQFALMAVERMQNTELSEFGYRFYMTKAERQAPLKQIRQRFLPLVESTVAGELSED